MNKRWVSFLEIISFGVVLFYGLMILIQYVFVLIWYGGLVDLRTKGSILLINLYLLVFLDDELSILMSLN
jgi:hypothetical protein